MSVSAQYASPHCSMLFYFARKRTLSHGEDWGKAAAPFHLRGKEANGVSGKRAKPIQRNVRALESFVSLNQEIK